ncbi:uncharacterized protein LOC8025447 [Ixodes scapularis]|uniref:uncharacterized protein LOC8025447 n=1 Tax=Ixodes scapularis TaxID=6945 RepID=UPI001C3851A6|nr:uncharacterized protein LOC8025447 [Ixodes scapularis]
MTGSCWDLVWRGGEGHVVSEWKVERSRRRKRARSTMTGAGTAWAAHHAIASAALLLGLLWLQGCSATEEEVVPCTEGKEVFMLATNARLDSKVFSGVYGVNLTNCAESCRAEPHCKSLTFVKNATSTYCQLMGDAVASGMVTHERMLSPVNGVYYLEKICLKGACDRLFVVEWIQGMELEGHDNRMLHKVSKHACLEACSTETSFVCRSAEYDENARECRLSRYDRFSRHIHFKRADPSVSYFDNTCAYKPVSGGHTAEILLLGNVEHPYSLVEYRGLSVSECGETCLRNALFPCRSFLFGRSSDRETFCGLTHQNRAGLLQNPGSFEPSQSLNYYEIARNLDACDDEDVKFELVSGKYMTDRPMKSSQTSSAHECLNLCRGEPKCRSVSYDYRRRLCHAHSDTLRTGADTNVKNDPQMNYFEKVCISTGNVCDKYWAFERVPGKELALGAATSKVIVEANTREECQAACLAHRDFLCHSAEFNYQLSECRLSPYSRFTSPAAEAKLEDSKFVVDYFENNCFKEIRGFCNTKKYRDQELILADLIIGTQSQEDCLQRCLHSGDFVCRSFSFERETQTCFLSHHTRKSAPDGATLRLPGTDLVELGACFDVFVDCEPQVMKARVKSNMVFKGKVYARGRPTTCSQDISSSMDFTLPIQLSGSDCGTISKTEGHFSNVLVIQSNDQVVTAMDKAIGVSCTFDVGNKTEFAAAKVSDPKQTDRSRGKPPLPELSLHILDMRGNERDSVSLGELVRVQVRMSEEDTYGIFVKNLIARDGTGSTNLTLIDKTGCPVEAKMMREIRTIDSQSKSLESYLEAFAFTGSSTLELEAEVVTCLERCKPVLCQIPTGRREDDIETVTSFGRRRRSADDDHLSEEEELTRTTLSKKVSIVANEFGVGRQTQDISYAFPVTAPTTSGKTSSMEDLIAEQLGVVCFEPTTSAVIGGLALFLEVFGFSTCLVFALRRRKDSTKDEPICYDNSIEGSTDFPSSAPY